MASYVERVVDKELDELFPTLSAIALDGPKGVGKTATAARRAASTFFLDSPAERELLRADPRAILRAHPPVLVDEWQFEPPLWDVVRRAVDDGAAPASFLLTGSATPRPGTDTHSGAGRIVSLRMRPLAFSERRLAEPTVSLAAMFNKDSAISGRSTLELPDYVREILASGFPGIRTLPPRARRLQLAGYVDRIVDRDVPEQGYALRRPQSLRLWLTAYSAATSTTASYSRILDAATTGDSDKPSKVTTATYRDLLTRLWILDPLPAWVPSPNPFTRLAVMPKHQLADPALAATLTGTTEQSIGSTRGFAGGGWLGQLFESLATLSVRVLAQAAEASVGHFRTRNGDREVDLVLERYDGKLVALEIKLAATVSDRDVNHLHWLRSVLGDRLADAAVLTTGPAAYRRADGIAVIPLSLLGP
ncbi:hypothetical protein BJ994_000531 [Arthrobacter pigmenti]|uniref:ATP-binding protein n=1 Tax=Arthrobacter pigmenti TaxID=271432 RepID=A0A846RNU1_9MICC|nr:DUF4143 domain-containing protein [Arthrobacter pigmenti]NJC21455.1 hypothetical protein [Arthrobacter pigmenti]